MGLEKVTETETSDKRVKDSMKVFDKSGDGSLQLDGVNNAWDCTRLFTSMTRLSHFGVLELNIPTSGRTLTQHHKTSMSFRE